MRQADLSNVRMQCAKRAEAGGAPAVCRGLTQLNGYCTDDTTMDLTDVYEYIAHRAETTVSFYYSSVRVCVESNKICIAVPRPRAWRELSTHFFFAGGSGGDAAGSVLGVSTGTGSFTLCSAYCVTCCIFDDSGNLRARPVRASSPSAARIAFRFSGCENAIEPSANAA